MENLIVFVVSFTIIFITYLIIYFVKRSKGRLQYMKEFTLLINKNHLKRNYLDYNKLGLIIVLLNSLIISIVGTVCTMIDMKYYWQLMIGFVLLMFSIYFSYGILGKILKKKEPIIEEKNGKKEEKNGNDKHQKNRKKMAK